MSARSTPFGLFSGCSVGLLGDVTELSLANRASYRRHVRLDMHYLAALCEELRRNPAIHDAVRYEPSSALWQCHDGLRYPEARVNPVTGERSFHLVSVEASGFLEATLDRAAKGETIPALAAALVDDEISLDEATSYIEEFDLDEAARFLNLEPTITGNDPLSVLCKRLGELAPVASSTRVLAAVREDLNRLGSSPVGEHPRTYRAIAKISPVCRRRWTYLDSFTSTSTSPAARSRWVRPPFERSNVPSPLFRRSEPAEQIDLRSFREHFSERYGRQGIQLLEALDDERGIGFGRDGHRSSDNSPLLAELPFPKRPRDPVGHRLNNFSFQRLGPSCEGERPSGRSPSRHREPCSRRPAELARCSLCVRRDRGALAAGTRLGRVSRADERRRRPVGSQLARAILPRRSDIAGAHVRAHLREEESLRPEAIFAESSTCRKVAWATCSAGPSCANTESRTPAVPVPPRAGEYHLQSRRVGATTSSDVAFQAARPRSHSADDDSPQLVRGRARGLPFPLRLAASRVRARMEMGHARKIHCSFFRGSPSGARFWHQLAGTWAKATGASSSAPRSRRDSKPCSSCANGSGFRVGSAWAIITTFIQSISTMCSRSKAAAAFCDCGNTPPFLR